MAIFVPEMAETDIIDLMMHHGVRPTANRILIAETLRSAGRPMSMMELEEAIGTIDKSGISRALALFREQHLVHTLQDGGDGVRYELCHSHSDSHDEDAHVHFYCTRCRKTFCLEDTHSIQLITDVGSITQQDDMIAHTGYELHRQVEPVQTQQSQYCTHYECANPQ